MKKQNVYIVLGGGAALGYAHIGVLAELEKRFQICGIIGTSMGAIIGALYASGLSPKNILEITSKISFKDFIKANIFGFKNGLLDTNKLLETFNHLTKNQQIEDLKIEFAAIAFDLIKKNTIVINKGSLSSAMLASSNLPFLNKPFEYNGHFLVDGGVGYPLPVEFIGFFKKNYPVIAVSVLPDLISDPTIINDESEFSDIKLKDDFFVINALKANIYNQAYLTVNALQNVKPEYFISAYKSSLSAWDFHKADEFYKVGINATLKMLELKKENKDNLLDEITLKSSQLFKRLRDFFNNLE